MTYLAKLSAPRQGDALMRERLFERIETLKERSLLWVEAPPGAGKTTLLSSYVEAKKLPALWYEVDAGDHDIGSFFHYLSFAAGRIVGPSPSRLPRFTAEFASEPQGFARKFFRELFDRLPDPCLVVFDGFEDGQRSEHLCGVVREAVAQAPPHVRIVVLSRIAPPASFARLAANGHMDVLGAADLLLHEDEAIAIARKRGVADAIARRLQAEAEGWAAGFRLMMEGELRAGAARAAATPGSKQELFDYFMEQLFKRGREETQRILLDLSLLPFITAPIAAAVSTSSHAIRVMDCLARQQLFAQRRARQSGDRDGEAVTYRLHGLFRGFLKQQLQRQRGEDGVRALALKSADALRQSGDCESAVDLYLQAGAWQEAIMLIRQLSNDLLRDVRCVRLVEWIEALPAELLEADQWLLYFVGSARLWTDPHEARAWLERAYALAATRRDESCVVRAVAGIVDAAFLEYSEFKSVDRWIEVLNNAVRSDAVCANPDVELRANVALLSATFYRRGNVPELQALAEHTLSLVERHDDVNLRTAAVAWLLSYVANTGRFELAARILPLAAALIEHSEVTPLRRGLCAYFTAWTHVSMCDAQGANTYMEKLMRLAEEFGLQRLRRFAAVIGFWIWMIDRQGDGQQWVEVFEHALGDAHPYDLASHNAMRALLAQSQNDVVSGMQYARLALPAYEQVGSPWHRLMIRAILLWAAVELGDELQARKVLSELRDLVRESRLDAYLLLLHQAEAWLMLRASEGERLVEKLRILFDNAGQFGLGMPMRFILPWMPRLCAEALHCGVSAPYVTGLIRAHGWSAPLLHLRQWPWPVRIHTLGRFSIEVDGEPISFSTKAPRKALALLKALICSSGVEVRDHQLIDALWKDDEADAARAAFNVTLHRLRRLLGHLDAIEVSDGCLTLNPKIVWVDAFAYEYLLANSADPSVEDIDEALQLYRGPLLPTDGAESWSAAARERMRAKFLHHVGRRAQQLESERRWDEAVALYLRGLDADNLSESFYQGLMRCHKECGRHAEALSLYWRLRQTLSVSLGISPSAHTEVLFQEIGQKARSARR